MSKPTVSVHFIENHTEEFLARIKANRKKLVRQYAASIQRIAAKNAPKKTGSGARSVYKSVSGEGSDYSERVSQAHRLNKYFKAEPEKTPGPQQALVAVAASHGKYMERRTGFFEKAVESQSGKFLRDVTHIHEKDL